MRMIVNSYGFDVEGDDGRTWGIDLHDDGCATLYLHGLREDSAARFTEDQYPPALGIDLSPEQAIDVLASLEAWLEGLHGTV